MSVTLQCPFVRALQKKERNVAILCKTVLYHTLIIFPLIFKRGILRQIDKFVDCDLQGLQSLIPVIFFCGET